MDNLVTAGLRRISNLLSWRSSNHISHTDSEVSPLVEQTTKATTLQEEPLVNQQSASTANQDTVTEQAPQEIVIMQPAKQGIIAKPRTLVYTHLDEPLGIYMFACLSLIVPLIGIMGIYIFNYGSGLGLRQQTAFKFLSCTTLVGLIFNSVMLFHTK